MSRLRKPSQKQFANFGFKEGVKHFFFFRGGGIQEKAGGQDPLHFKIMNIPYGCLQNKNKKGTVPLLKNWSHLPHFFLAILNPPSRT